MEPELKDIIEKRDSLVKFVDAYMHVHGVGGALTPTNTKNESAPQIYFGSTKR